MAIATATAMAMATSLLWDTDISAIGGVMVMVIATATVMDITMAMDTVPAYQLKQNTKSL